MKAILACDMGGTRIKLGLVRAGKIVADQVIPAHSSEGLASRLPAVAEALKALCGAVHMPVNQCEGIAVSFPSLIDVVSGKILAAYGKYHDAPQVDLRAWARTELDLPLAIENDARMASIGEWQYGAGRGYNNLVMITLGTGIGTSAIIEGKILRGAHGQAGCFGGHLSVKYGGRACTCGNIGCAEAEASTSVLPELARRQSDFSTSVFAREPVLDYAAVVRHAARGDECARRLLDHSILVWGAVAVNLIHAYDPEMIVIGGGIMAGADVIFPPLSSTFAIF